MKVYTYPTECEVLTQYEEKYGDLVSLLCHIAEELLLDLYARQSALAPDMLRPLRPLLSTLAEVDTKPRCRSPPPLLRDSSVVQRRSTVATR